MNLGIFTHAPVNHSKLQAEFFENLFTPTAERGGAERGGAERGGESYALLYRNSIRKYEDELKH